MAVERVKVNRNAIAVIGLNDFRKQLKKIIDEGGQTGETLLKDANWRVSQYVVEKAQARAATVGKMQAKAATALRASRTSSRAQIVGTASSKIPFFFGAEFGAKPDILRRERRAAGWAGPGRYRGYRQFLPWKKPGGGNAGYFLFPTMREESDKIREIYDTELRGIMRMAFPDQS